MGTATFSVIHRRTLRRNISYPYGDSNINGRAIVYPLVRNISYPYGDSNRLYTSLGIALLRKHFIPLWGQQRLTINNFDI